MVLGMNILRQCNLHLKPQNYNVLHWKTRKNELSNVYASHCLDVILINSHGLNDNERFKIFSYIYQRTKSGERADGVALAVRTGFEHCIIGDFNHKFLAVEINTRGPVILATGYLPPCHPFLPYLDFLQLIRLHIPINLFGDLNAQQNS